MSFMQKHDIHYRMYYNRIGASIVVLTKTYSQASSNQLIYNPDCFLLHQDFKVPFTSVDNVSTLSTNFIVLKIVL